MRICDLDQVLKVQEVNKKQRMEENFKKPIQFGTNPETRMTEVLNTETRLGQDSSHLYGTGVRHAVSPLLFFVR